MAIQNLLNTDETAEVIGVSRRTLVRWRAERRGPPWVKLNGVVRHDPEDVQEWIRKHRREPVAECT